MWIARDKDGDLWLYGQKPHKFRTRTDIFCSNENDEIYVKLYDNIFPEVTFENSPIEVELKIKNHGKK